MLLGYLLSNLNKDGTLKITLISVSCLIAFWSFIQTVQSLRSQLTNFGTSRLEVCLRKGLPEEFRGAYSWLHAHPSEASSIQAYVSDVWEISLYCFRPEGVEVKLNLHSKLDKSLLNKSHLANQELVFIPKSILSEMALVDLRDQYKASYEDDFVFLGSSIE